MQNHLSLLSSNGAKEKRVFPRFPFCFFIFKLDEKYNSLNFKVKDISYTGMQLELMFGEFDFKEKNNITGQLKWNGNYLKVSSKIEWIKDNLLGVSFNYPEMDKEELFEFLSVDNIASSFKPLHNEDFGESEFPNLKCWLRADGPMEIFVWNYNDGEFSKFVFILMENFLEWENGKSIKTGKVISNRNLEIPLTDSDEFLVEIDNAPNLEVVKFCSNVLEKIDESKISKEIKKFITMKLST